MAAVKKIVVIGPESTGKSTLCEQLAKYYRTSWCPEYAREYLTTNGPAYTFDDLLTIAKGQVALETAMVNRQSSIVNGVEVHGEEVHSPWPIVHGEYKAETLMQYAGGNVGVTAGRDSHMKNGNQQPATIFIDTDLYVMKVWCEYVFSKCHTYILEQIALRKYDLYLFCNIDLPWEADPLREYPNEKPRQELHRIYKDILINQTTPWVDISGSYGVRLQTAINAIDRMLEI